MAIEVTRVFIRCSFSNPDSVTSRIQSPDSSVYDQQDALLQKLFSKKRYLRNAFLHSFVLSWYFIFGLGFSADDKSSHWLAAPPLHKNELHHYNSKYQKEEWTDKVSRPHCLKLGCSPTTMQQQATIIIVAKKTAHTGNIATFLDQNLAFHNPLIDYLDNLHPVASFL